MTKREFTVQLILGNLARYNGDRLHYNADQVSRSAVVATNVIASQFPRLFENERSDLNYLASREELGDE